MAKVKERGVVSYPKTGCTWIRLFLEYYRLFTGIKFKRMQVVFRHDDKLEFRRRVLLIRHPCDVMVSYYMHRTVRIKTQMSMAQFVRGKRYGIPCWNERYTAWAERETNQMVVRYEDLFDDGVWIDMLEFFDIPFYEGAFRQARDKTEFDTIRHNLAEIATFPSAWRYLAAEHGKYNVIKPGNPEAHKFRRGVVGGYVDYLNEEDIAYILDNFTLGERLEPYRLQYLEESKRA